MTSLQMGRLKIQELKIRDRLIAFRESLVYMSNNYAFYVAVILEIRTFTHAIVHT